jgi:2-oxoglutarate dehydrogenase E1 component
MASSSDYLDHIYTAWRQDPTNVHSSWQEYFNAVENGLPTSEPTFEPLGKSSFSLNAIGRGAVKDLPALSTASDHYSKTVRLVRAYQDFGHKKAETNPLDLPEKKFPYPEELEPEFYGFTESDMDHEFVLGPELLPHFISATPRTMTLRDIIKTCEDVYCGSIGAEYSHVDTVDEREWIRERLEVPEPYRYSTEEKKQILDRLVWTTNFEKFMSAKFPNAKRFSIEGVETQIPALKAIIDASAENGVKNIIFPCCHRGKLNVLSNVGRKPNELIFSEFSSDSESRLNISGDVKYHLGISHDRKTPSGKYVNILILPNPSHLEAQNTLGQGMARAVQHQNQGDRASTMVLNSHTDASFAGQGVIYETLGLSGLKFYETGGTVHLIINNQVGFTTDAESARSSPYASDIAKSISAPIFHVNADDAEAVVFVGKLAADYRAKFGKDCWVDMICYRKHGHNEMDQPFFTQPMMYEQIEKKTPHLESYTEKLVRQGVVTVDEVKQMEARAWKEMTKSLENSSSPEALEREYLTAPWKDMKTPEEVMRESFAAKATAIDHSTIGTIASKLGIPEEPFKVHKSLRRILQKRQQSLTDGRDIDWATAEALAVGSLCLEGHHVRVSGQDVQRGTFSQRHAVLHDQKNGGAYLPLNNLSADQAEFTIGNSSLSEYGIMGFDYGYSCMYPNSLVMWEAQFGDFANNAQCIIDQFISSAENKWLLRSGLILSLPHGFDGQGPEHSSARMERFLQLCSEDGRFFPTKDQIDRQHQDANMQVVQMTTPANVFHVLRRQLHREFRKRRSYLKRKHPPKVPSANAFTALILFFSKSLLRHPSVKSQIEDFTGDSRFQPLIADPAHGTSIAPASQIKRVIYCSGQVYFALVNYRDTHGITDTAITRIEQLHPFPWEQARDNLTQYSNASDIVWCQEESLNDGPWSFAKTRLETIFDTTNQHKGGRLRFAGRGATSSVATGFGKVHRAQEAALLEEAFQGPE